MVFDVRLETSVHHPMSLLPNVSPCACSVLSIRNRRWHGFVGVIERSRGLSLRPVWSLVHLDSTVRFVSPSTCRRPMKGEITLRMSLALRYTVTFNHSLRRIPPNLGEDASWRLGHKNRGRERSSWRGNLRLQVVAFFDIIHSRGNPRFVAHWRKYPAFHIVHGRS